MNEQEIPVRRIELWVCDLCLAGEGGECHVPGCAFWCHDAPTGDVLTVLRNQTAYAVMAESERSGSWIGDEIARARSRVRRTPGWARP
jgi:hypothetical protein